MRISIYYDEETCAILLHTDTIRKRNDSESIMILQMEKYVYNSLNKLEFDKAQFEYIDSFNEVNKL